MIDFHFRSFINVKMKGDEREGDVKKDQMKKRSN